MSSSDEEMSSDEVDVRIHRISSHVGADGSAEVTFAAAMPMTRTMSTPLHGSMSGMGYSMRRVLSRDDSAGVVSSKQEAQELMPSNNTRTVPLVKTKSDLSPEGIAYSVRRVFSKENGEWQSAIEVEGLVPHEESVSRVSSRVDASDEVAEAILLSDQFDDNSLRSSGYALRHAKSTPLRGMEDGYSLKRTKTSGHDDSSLRNPSSLVRSRFSSVGKKSSKGQRAKDDGSTTIAESESFSTVSDYGFTGRRKKRKVVSTPTIIVFIVLILLGVAGGGVYLLKPEVFGAGENSDSNQSTNSLTKLLEPHATSQATKEAAAANPVGLDINDDLSLLEDTVNAPPTSQAKQGVTTAYPVGGDIIEDDPSIVEDTVDASPTSQAKQGVTTSITIGGDVKDDPSLVEDTIDAPPPTTQKLSQQASSSPTQNVTIVNATAATQNVTIVNVATNIQKMTAVEPVNITHPAAAPPVENITRPVTSQNLTSSLANITSSKALSSNASTSETMESEVSPEDTITTFYVMADAPYSDEERYHLMPRHIDQLGDDGEFLVHLGDLQYAAVDRCREGAYYEAREILKRSRMPTFVLPGDNDINDCNSMSHGEEMWMKYFHLFDERWDHSFDVTRWGDLEESFSFIQKGVLYLGLNMIGGTPYSWSEKTQRHQRHLEQVRALFEQHEDKFEVLVLLKHAEPGRNHRDFFGNGDRDGLFIDMIRRLGKPTIHFHGDWHEYYEEEGEYGVGNYMRISLDGESVAPPIRVTIDVSKPNPISVSRRQSNLRVKCCSEGWPRSDDDDDDN